VHLDSSTNAGRVGFYVHNTLSFNVNKNVNFALPNAQSLWIDIKKKDFVTLGVIYRHPVHANQHIDDFSNSLNTIFWSLQQNQVHISRIWRLNLNLLAIQTNDTIRIYANTLISCSCKCIINKPTRISMSSKRLLDHIYTNDLTNVMKKGILVTDISDRLGTFALKNKKIVLQHRWINKISN